MRIVVKVGTSTLAHSTGRLNIRHTEDLVKVLSDLKNAGHEVILVSSGAIGMGVGKLSLPSRPGDMATKQACAAVGQCELMYTYDRLFTAYNHNVAQILLTGVDVEYEGRRLNFQNTLTRLLELGALPIINENDTVATDEITSIGDNDTLAAIVTCCIHADLLVLLSDIDGLYTANPHTHPDAKLIPVVERITPEVLALADGAGSALGTGGMSTKLRAAQMVTAEGADMVIANGSHPELLYDIADGRPAGTRFAGQKGGLIHDDTGDPGSRPRGKKRAGPLLGRGAPRRPAGHGRGALLPCPPAGHSGGQCRRPGSSQGAHLGGHAGPAGPDTGTHQRHGKGHPGSG